MVMHNLNVSLSEVKSEPRSLHERKVQLQKQVQQQTKKQEKEQLFQAFVHHVKTTGRYDYPDLVDAVRAAFEVSIAPPGTMLLGRQVDVICIEIQNACSLINSSSHKLEVELQALGTFPCEGYEDMQTRQLHRQHLAEILQFLSAGINTLNELTREHALSSKVAQLTLQDTNVNAKDEQAWIRYCCESLCYIHQFLVTQLDEILHELMKWNDNDKRLMGYCSELRVQGNMLGDRLKKVVKDKQFNHKFL
jgi:hypothetical protein